MRPRILSATRNSSSVHFAWPICRVQNVSRWDSGKATVRVVFCAAIAIEASMSSSELLVRNAVGGRKDVDMHVIGWIWFSSGRVEWPGFSSASYASSKRSFIGCRFLHASSHSFLTLIAEGRRTRNAAARRIISMGRPLKLLLKRPSNPTMKSEDTVDFITTLSKREMRYFDDAACHRSQPCFWTWKRIRKTNMKWENSPRTRTWSRTRESVWRGFGIKTPGFSVLGLAKVWFFFRIVKDYRMSRGPHKGCTHLQWMNWLERASIIVCWW